MGGLGEREGGSGILISAFGAGKRFPKTGAGAVRLFIVLLRLFDDCSIGKGGVDWLGFLGGLTRGADIPTRVETLGGDSCLKEGFLAVPENVALCPLSEDADFERSSLETKDLSLSFCKHIAIHASMRSL